MQSVSAEKFTGEQGRKLVDDTLHQLDRTTLSGQQQTLPRELLQSAQSTQRSSSWKNTLCSPCLCGRDEDSL